jgi:putative endonuclease
LQLKGYRILARRARPGPAEIDIIARRGQMIVFVEVKQRGDPMQARLAVSPASWRRLSAAAEFWIAPRAALANLDWRYDLIVISPWRWPQHFRDYWRP